MLHNQRCAPEGGTVQPLATVGGTTMQDTFEPGTVVRGPLYFGIHVYWSEAGDTVSGGLLVIDQGTEDNDVIASIAMPAQFTSVNEAVATVSGRLDEVLALLVRQDRLPGF